MTNNTDRPRSSSVGLPTKELNCELVRHFSDLTQQVQESIEARRRASSVGNAGDSTLTTPYNDVKLNIDVAGIEMRDDHLISVADVKRRYKVDVDVGLSDTEASARLERDGPNALSPPPQTSEWVKLCHHLFSFFSMILWAGAGLCALNYFILSPKPEVSELCLSIVLVSVVVLTALFSWHQDAKSSKIMEGFKNFIPDMQLVLRDGRKHEVLSENIVVGDVIVLRGGDRIPADCRCLEVNNFHVDNSSLTGESEPQKRSVNTREENALEAPNMAFFGTLATEGSALCIVTRTGDRTTIGGIARLAATATRPKTPLAIEIEHFIRLISVIALVNGVIFFIVGYFRDVPHIENAVFAIGIIIANVPEGLLATVTVALAITAKRMAQKNVMVKNLESVETLGSTTVIASDKTGTLTQNRMTVANLYYDGAMRSVGHLRRSSEFNASDATFERLRLIGSLCNNAVFTASDDEDVPVLHRQTDGDATESGFLKFFQPFGDVQQCRQDNRVLAEVPFKSANKYQVSVHLQGNDEAVDRLLVMKGAPERVLERCSTHLVDGKPQELGGDERGAIESAMRVFMGGGERVLACAYTTLPQSEYGSDFVYETDDENNNLPASELTFVGLVSLIDPPRDSVPDAMLSCQRAGIKVIMVTGDHPDTAEAIARQVNVLSGPTRRDIALQDGLELGAVAADDDRIESIVITGQRLLELDDQQLDDVLDYKGIVFARTSPEQKLRIVKALQDKRVERRGQPDGGKKCRHIVAVTGDGVNDAPALKKADIGIAMGIAGSAVAKEAADMILLNDDFSSIVKGVEEGRVIFENLKKSIAYTLTSNIPEIAPFLSLMLLNIPLPLTTLLILCIDLGTDVLPAIALAYESKEGKIMAKKPRDSNLEKLVDGPLIAYSYLQIGIIQTISAFMCYFIVLSDYGFSPSILFGRGSQWSDLVVKGLTLNDPSGASPDAILRTCYDETSEACRNPVLALQHAQTAFFVAIVVAQIACALVTKTRRRSLLRHSFGNMSLNASLVLEVLLVVFLVYTPGLHVLGTAPLLARHVLLTIPFAVFIIVYDEVRKLLVRRSSSSCIRRLAYY